MPESDEVKIAVGFALESGAKEIVKRLIKGRVDPSAVSFIVGLAFGTTEPAALRTLMKYTPSVYLYRGEGMFHPKVYFFRKGQSCDLLVGSANLSWSAFHKNVEVVFHSKCAVKSKPAREYLHIFRDLEKRSSLIDKDQLERYKKSWKRTRVSRNESRLLRMRSRSRTSSSRVAPDVVRNSRSMARYLKNERNIAHNRPRDLKFRGNEYVFTGRFDYGIQDECMREIERRNGLCADHVTGRTAVLVIGSKGSTSYLWKKYGTKIEYADRLRKKTGRPLIIMEDIWRRFLKPKSVSKGSWRKSTDGT